MVSPKFLICCSLRSKIISFYNEIEYFCLHWTQFECIVLKYFKVPSIRGHLANALIHLPFTFDYYFFFAFNINKIKKKINPQNPMDPRRKKFHSLKPCQTKEIHSSYSSFPAEWNLVRNCKPYWLEILYAKDLIFWSLNVVMILEHQN